MAVVAGGMHVLGRRKRGSFIGGNVVVDRNFVKQKRVAHAIAFSLKEDHVLHILRLKIVNRSRMKFVQRNADSHPAPGREVASEFSERKRITEACRWELSYLQTFAGCGQHDAGQIVGSDGLQGEAPDVKIAAGKSGEAIAEVDDAHFRFPAASLL